MTTNHGFWQGIAETLRGRGQLRLIFQPVVAIILGIRLGISDAREKRGPFVMRLLHTNRLELLRGAFSDVIIPFSFAIIIDAILQYLALGIIRPLAALIVGFALVWLPFASARGFTNRIVHHRRTSTPARRAAG